MKRIISILIIAAMCFALVGCSETKPEILGVYETSVNMTDFIGGIFDEALGATEIGYDLYFADYMEECNLTLIFTFNEDGTYSYKVDESSALSLKENMKQSTYLLMNDLVVHILSDSFSSMGFEFESIEEMEEFMGMSVEDAFLESSGMDIETIAGELIDENIDIESFIEETESSGKYKTEDGKLYTAEGQDADFDESSYETYTVEGDNIVITGGYGTAEQDIQPYPFTLVKVA